MAHCLRFIVADFNVIVIMSQLRVLERVDRNSHKEEKRREEKRREKDSRTCKQVTMVYK